MRCLYTQGIQSLFEQELKQEHTNCTMIGKRIFFYLKKKRPVLSYFLCKQEHVHPTSHTQLDSLTLRIKASLYSDPDRINLRQVSVMRTNTEYRVHKLKNMTLVLLGKRSALYKKD